MSEAAPPHFVRVSADGKRFEIDGNPWYFAGCNCYYLMTRAADPSLRHEVTEVLDAAASCGLTAIRTWAFCEGSEWNALQPRPGEFDERVFRGLDWVIAEAGKRHLRVMLVLVNYWAAYGGMPQYVRWSCERRGVDVKDDANLFYADPLCQDVFHNFLATIVARQNTETGVLYREDPTIMAWGLANEARCVGDFSGSVLQDWAASTAEFVKSIDPHHLLTLGTEGFLGGATPGLMKANPYDCLNQGCDFMRNHSISHIDFCTIHLWPDSWLQCGEDRKLDFSHRWIDCHVQCCEDLGKPLVVTEFGKKPAGPEREAFYHRVFGGVINQMAKRKAVAGSFFWMTAARSYEDYDSTTIYLTPPKQPDASDAHNLKIVETIRKHAIDVVYSAIVEYVKADEGLAGSFFWSATGPTISDYDGFSVYLTPPTARQQQHAPSEDGDSQKQDSSSHSTTDERRGHESGSRWLGTSDDVGNADNNESRQRHQEGQDRSQAEIYSKTKGQEGVRSTTWVERETVRVIRMHAAEMTSLSGGWGSCNFM